MLKSFALLAALTASAAAQTVMVGPETYAVVNSTTGGTVLYRAVKLVAGGVNGVATLSAISDNAPPDGVCMSTCGNSGTAGIAKGGIADLIFDTAPTAGDYVALSTTSAGAGHGAGNGLPPATCFGKVQVATPDPILGTYKVLLSPCPIAQSTGSLVFVLETPSGAINGSNTVFTVGHTPTIGSYTLYLNGLVQIPGVNYTLSGAVATMTAAPQTGDAVTAYYGYTGTGGGSVFLSETPAGTPNGSLVNFTMSHTPNPTSSLAVYLNGLLQPSSQYSSTGGTLTMGTAPQTGDSVSVSYTF